MFQGEVRAHSKLYMSGHWSCGALRIEKQSSLSWLKAISQIMAGQWLPELRALPRGMYTLSHFTIHEGEWDVHEVVLETQRNTLIYNFPSDWCLILPQCSEVVTITIPT